MLESRFTLNFSQFMLQDNPLLAQLKAQFNPKGDAKSPEILLEGTVRSHPKGFGFVDIDPKTNHYVAPAQMKKLFDGDKVKGKLVKKGDQFVFMPSELVSSKLDRFLGQIVIETEGEHESYWIQPENPNLQKIKLRKPNQTLAPESWVVANLIQHPFNGKEALAKFESLIAETETNHLMWYKALARQTRSPESLEINLNSFTDQESQHRKDLTDLPFFTIDSEQTEDMDDAICIQTNAEGHFLLSVAIADPSAYIPIESEVEQIARSKLFTSYLPNLTIDMLPPILATELCSLKPNENKAALLIQVELKADGEIMPDSVFFDLVTIRSQAKLSYTQVSDFVEQKQVETVTSETSIPTNLWPALQTLFELMQVRQNWRKQNAFVFENRIDYRFKFDESANVIGIEKQENRSANLMVEEAMLIANIAVAQRLDEIGLGIFSAHSGIDPKFYGILSDLVQSTSSNYQTNDLDDYDQYVALRQETDSDPVLKYRVSRLHAPAHFSFAAQPHFSLGFKAYATGTSPIRKYSDLINHRLIKADLLDQPLPELKMDLLDDLVEARKKIRQVEREITNQLYALYFKEHLNQPFDAIITDINRGGFKAQLTENGAFVFVPAAYLHTSKNEVEINLNQAQIKVKGEIAYSLLDSIKVQLTEIKDNGNLIAKPSEH